MKRLRIVYIPGLNGKQPRPSDVTDENNKVRDVARHSKLYSDDQKFNELINNVNFILYYLTKVEIERAAQESQGISDFQEPIQIQYAHQYHEWMFQDDLEARIHGDRQGKFVNDSIINNFETQSQYFKQSSVSGQNEL